MCGSQVTGWQQAALALPALAGCRSWPAPTQQDAGPSKTWGATRCSLAFAACSPTLGPPAGVAVVGGRVPLLGITSRWKGSLHFAMRIIPFPTLPPPRFVLQQCWRVAKGPAAAAGFLQGASAVLPARPCIPGMRQPQPVLLPQLQQRQRQRRRSGWQCSPCSHYVVNTPALPAPPASAQNLRLAAADPVHGAATAAAATKTAAPAARGARRGAAPVLR